ncbi:T9SS type A sorting domain-containing protein [Winogradskyella litoriviva]|uniref:T9SS type A sorting domain-containing protein n=1 Tax=Winogradskyella litoriviva TaxID=1220182 RepID=A0ABX2E357_9FLAO|nr:T9SS type A sorting domain-containing protein [Winogradskyella litoriviva]NRD22933.1 T9SS type A sorting domain-containing protein [Winogradskyella litoriviva]
MNLKTLIFCSLFISCSIISFSQSPGGVGKSDMSMWVRGDFGVNDNGTLTWADDSGLGNELYQSTADSKPTQSSAINFNSTFTFDGADDRLAISNLNYASNTTINQLYGFVIYKTDVNSSSFNGNWSFVDFDRSESFNFYVHGDGRLAMSYQSDGIQDLVANTASNDNSAHIGTFIFNNLETNESVMRLDGNVDYSEDVTTNPILTTSNRYGFVGDGSEAATENGTANNVNYDGEIAEIIFYEENSLTAEEIHKIESYLAVKYGITLNQNIGSYVNSSNTVIWNNTAYWNDVAGVINDSSVGAINQKVAQSNSNNGLIISSSNDYTSLNNDATRTDFPLGTSLMFGHNGNDFEVEEYDVANNEYINKRKWYFQEIGETGTVYLAMPKSNFISNEVDVIVSNDDTFDASDVRYTLNQDSTHFYISLNLTDGDRVTFIEKNPVTPGGVFGSKLWYKADQGVTQTDGSVENVTNQAGNGYQMTQASADNRPSAANAMNYNPTFTFDGTNDRLPIENLNYTSSDNLNQVYVWTVYSTSYTDLSGTSSSYDNKNWAFLDFDRSEWFSTSVGGDGTLGFSYHPSGSNIVDVKGTTVTNTGIPQIGGYVFNTSEVNETTIRLNGTEEISADLTNVALNSSTRRYGYLGDGSEAGSFNSAGNNIYYSGDISEVIYFENVTLEPSKIETIESYLALKYGITLNQDVTPTNYYASNWNGATGSVSWDATENVGYNNDIAGIGLDTKTGLDQRISKSRNDDALIAFALDNDFEALNTDYTTRSTEHSADLSFMTWGNNNETIQWSSYDSDSCDKQILDRVWRIDETGTVGTVYLSIPDYSSTANSKLPASITDLSLITKSSDADFSIDATEIPLTLNGTNWELPAGIDFADGTYFTFIGLSSTKLAVGTDWDAAASWSPAGVPSATDNVTIPTGINMSITTSSAKANSITVKAGASLYIDAVATLTANCKVQLESISTSYSSLILDGSIIGDVFYDRHINEAAPSGQSTAANDLISAPLTGQTFGDFRAANPNILSGTIGGSPAFLFGPFKNSTFSYTIYSPSDDTSTLDAGIGYRTGSTDNGTYTFTGNVETSEVITPIVSNGDIWNLIGNPYPSYISVQEFFNETSNIDAMNSGFYFGIYGYDGTAHDDWVIYNLANTTASTLITPGQGFFVATDPNVSATIKFTPAMRTVGSSDDFIAGRSSTTELTYLKLKASASDNSYHTDFYFNSNSTLGLDYGYDSTTWNNETPSFSLYSNLVENNEGKPMAIQSLNDTDLNNVTIPLGVHANAGETLTLSIEESTLPNGIEVYLQDTETNTTTLLNNADYIITPSSNISGTGRFYLNIQASALSIKNPELNELVLYNNPNSNVLQLNGLLSEMTTLDLYDVQGRLVETKELKLNVNSQEIEFSNFKSGIFVTKITSANVSKVQKVIFYNN